MSGDVHQRHPDPALTSQEMEQSDTTLCYVDEGGASCNGPAARPC